MAYVPVPKDLSKVKTKVALNLTKRQIICFSLAGVCGLPVYFFTKTGLGTDVAATLMVIVMLPFFWRCMRKMGSLPKRYYSTLSGRNFYVRVSVFISVKICMTGLWSRTE